MTPLLYFAMLYIEIVNEASESGIKDRKTMWNGDRVEKSPICMSERVRVKCLSISRPLLQGKSSEVYEKIERENGQLPISDGWFYRWEKRDSWIIGDHIYKCDDTGLRYKFLPSKSLASKWKASAPWYKISKKPVNALTCSNATGIYKLPLALIKNS